MITFFKNWFIQRYLWCCAYAMDHTSSYVCMEFKPDGKWETLVAGPGDERTEGLVHVFVDQLIHHGKEKTLVVIMHSDNNNGVVVAMKSNRRYFSRFFKQGLYDMPLAFGEITEWCMKEETWLS